MGDSVENFFYKKVPLFWDIATNPPDRYRFAVRKAVESESKNLNPQVLNVFNEFPGKYEQEFRGYLEESKKQVRDGAQKMINTILDLYDNSPEILEKRSKSAGRKTKLTRLTSSQIKRFNSKKAKLLNKYNNFEEKEENRLRSKYISALKDERRVARRVIDKYSLQHPTMINRGFTLIENAFTKIRDENLEKYLAELRKEARKEEIEAYLNALDLEKPLKELAKDMEAARQDYGRDLDTSIADFRKNISDRPSDETPAEADDISKLE